MKKAEAVEEVDTRCHFFIVAPLSLTAVQVSVLAFYALTHRTLMLLQWHILLSSQSCMHLL
jgi:hypothetical protein